MITKHFNLLRFRNLNYSNYTNFYKFSYFAHENRQVSRTRWNHFLGAIYIRLSVGNFLGL